MKNQPIIYKLANPFGITIYMFVGIAMLIGAITRFIANEPLLALASLLGGCGFTSSGVCLIVIFRNARKKESN